MWFTFVDDLGYILNATTQDTRYVSHCYWPHRVSQSSIHMSTYFLIKYIVPSMIRPRSMPRPVQYTPSVLTQQVGARPLPESRHTLK